MKGDEKVIEIVNRNHELRVFADKLNALTMDDVIEIKKPEPDSQYRLVPCKCKSDNVAYVQYNGRGGAAWRVTCFDCKHTVDKGNRARHDAQRAWNKEVRT